MKVLIVDDVADYRLLMKSAVHMAFSKDVDVRFAECGGEAFHVYRDHGPFDLILTDLYMPRVNGDEFAARVRESDKTTPIYLISSTPGFAIKPQNFTSLLDKHDFEWIVDSLKAFRKTLIPTHSE